MGVLKKIGKEIQRAGDNVSDGYQDWGKDALSAVLPVYYIASGGTAYDAKRGRDAGTGAVGGAVSPYARSYARLDGTKPPQDPGLPPPIPTADPLAPDVAARALRRRQRLLGAQGRGSTILTGPLGLTDGGGGAPKTLLGA